MVVIDVTANNCTPQTIVIGRRGTYDTMQIAFDLSYLVETYGSGVAVLAVKRSQDESAYPAVVTQEDNTLTWTVSETDTAYVGAGEAQLMWYVDGGLAKTIIYPMVVMRDILATAEEPPDGYENWVEHLTELGSETQQNAQDAAQSASEAETAQGAAEDAADRAETAIVHAPIIQGGYWYIWDNEQYVNTNVRAEGEKGGKGDTGEKGDTGNGIVSITKTGTAGLVDTYTVTYTDGTTTTFTVTNGEKGDKGDTGNGIASIAKTGTSGNVDTYTITYTNGQTTTFTVTNGAVTSVAGKTGAVTLDAGDVAFSESATYQSGTVGAELTDLNRQLSDLEDTVSTTQIINTASGAIASFDDGADGQPIKKLVAQIEPVQDLHGQDAPYPAGGMGNKWNEGWEAGTINVSSGNETAANNSIRSKSYSPCTPDTDYYVFCGAGSSQWFLGVCWYDENKQFISGVYRNRMTVTSPSNAAYFKITTNTSGDVYGNTYNQDIAVNNPATVTTYHPYSNICPISGHTGAEIQQTGKNLLRLVESEMTNVGWDREFPFSIKAGTYTLSCQNKFVVDSLDGCQINLRDDNNNNIVAITTGYNFGNVEFSKTSVITEEQANAITKILFQPRAGGCTFANIMDAEIMFELGSSATDFNPFTGNQISVNWETEAGTVYGGSDELIGGALEANMSRLNLGDLNWSHNASPSFFYAVLSGDYDKAVSDGLNPSNAICTQYKSVGYETVNNTNCSFGFNTSGNVIKVKDDAYSDAATFKTAMSAVYVVYEIIEPHSYTHEGIAVSTLYGTNNVWVDTGDTEVTYPADTKLYIDGKITQAIAAALNA